MASGPDQSGLVAIAMLGQQFVSAGAGLLGLAVGEQGVGVEGQRRQHYFPVTVLPGRLDGAGGVGQSRRQVAAGQQDQAPDLPAGPLHVVRRAGRDLGQELVGAGEGGVPAALPVVLGGPLDALMGQVALHPPRAGRLAPPAPPRWLPHPHMQIQGGVLLVGLGDRLPDRQRCPDCSLGVVLVGGRGAEQGHHGIADELLHVRRSAPGRPGAGRSRGGQARTSSMSSRSDRLVNPTRSQNFNP
jgi:hypothetical protein